MPTIQENDSNEVSSNRTIGTTSKGKEIGMNRDKATGLFRICFKSGGELPPELCGLWNYAHGEAAIKTYLLKNIKIKSD